MSDYYAELTSRNWAFVAPEDQQRIRTTRILQAGCGLGSAIALQALQTGFTRFTLIDFDTVEVSNLNRQAFDRAHVGRNKAEALGEVLAARTEALEVEALDARVSRENAADLVARADIVVNTVDFDDATYALNEAARAAGVPVVFPMNVGWGGFCLVFAPDGPGLEQMVGPKPPPSDAAFIGAIMGSSVDFELPEYLARRLHELPEIVSASDLPAPQLGIAAARSAGLVAEAMTRLALGLPVRTAPRPMHIDCWEAWAG